MIQLESTRAKRHPILDTDQKSKSIKNFDPRQTTGWKQSDPTLVAKMYQRTKEEVEKWLHVRAALVHIELSREHKIILQAKKDSLMDGS